MEITVGVLGADGTEQAWQLAYSGGEDATALTLTNLEGRTWSAVGRDLFEAMQRLRELIEPERYLLLCNGARVDAYPSGMSREMSNGSVLYLLQQNRAAWRKVDIFDRAEPKAVGTVAAQEAYFQRWLDGPKRRSLAGRVNGVTGRYRVRWLNRGED